MENEGFDVALVCLKGHCLNESSVKYPKYNSKHCSDCGEPGITECQDCKTSIRGRLEGYIGLEAFKVPNFCHGCGKPYPWAAQKTATART